MNAVVPFFPQETEIDLDVDKSYDVADPWSQVAINAQSDTAAFNQFFHVTTDLTIPRVYETTFRFAKPSSTLRGAAPDGAVLNLNTLTRDAWWFAEAQFVVTRTAPPVQRPKGNTNAILAEWEGYVTRIDTNSIEARLAGLKGEGIEGELEDATIPMSEIAESDRSLVAVGGLFRLCICYEKSPAGELRKYSSVVFRRLPAYTQADLDAAHARTRARLNALRVE